MNKSAAKKAFVVIVLIVMVMTTLGGILAMTDAPKAAVQTKATPVTTAQPSAEPATPAVK